MGQASALPTARRPRARGDEPTTSRDEDLEERRFDRGEAEMDPRPRAGDPTPSGPLQETLLEQVRLVGVLDGVGLLADALRERGQADRPAGEAATQHVEDRSVDLVEAELVDPEHARDRPRPTRR